MSRVHRRSGIIVPRPATSKSFKGQPKGRQHDLEITFEECDDIRKQLPGCDLCFNHLFNEELGEYGPVLGKITRSYWNKKNQLCVDFDVNADNLSGKVLQMVLKEGYFQYLSLNTAALKSSGRHTSPLEVSLVNEPARPGSIIFPEAAKSQGLPESEIRGEHSQLMDAALRNNSTNPYTVSVQASFTSPAMETSEVPSQQQQPRHDARDPSSGKFVSGAELAELQHFRDQRAASAASSATPMEVEDVASAALPAAASQPNSGITAAAAAAATGGVAPMEVDSMDAIDAIAHDASIPESKKAALIKDAISRDQREKELKRKLSEIEAERDNLKQNQAAHAKENAQAIGLFQNVLTSLMDPNDSDRLAMVDDAFKRGDIASIGNLAGAQLQSVAAALHGKGSLPSHLAKHIQHTAEVAASSSSSSYSNARVLNKRARASDDRGIAKAVAAAKDASSDSHMSPEVKALMCAYHETRSGMGNEMHHVAAGREAHGALPFWKQSWNAALDHDPSFQALVENAAWPEHMDCSSVIRLSNVISGTVNGPPNRHFTTTTDCLDFQAVAAGQQVRGVARVKGDIASEVIALQMAGLGLSTNGSAHLQGAAARLMIF